MIEELFVYHLSIFNFNQHVFVVSLLWGLYGAF